VGIDIAAFLEWGCGGRGSRIFLLNPPEEKYGFAEK
jgi:hypothetical protein